jgi:hypothetical protein
MVFTPGTPHLLKASFYTCSSNNLYFNLNISSEVFEVPARRLKFNRFAHEGSTSISRCSDACYKKVRSLLVIKHISNRSVWSKYLVMSPKRQTDWLTVSLNGTLTLTLSVWYAWLNVIRRWQWLSAVNSSKLGKRWLAVVVCVCDCYQIYLKCVSLYGNEAIERQFDCVPSLCHFQRFGGYIVCSLILVEVSKDPLKVN